MFDGSESDAYISLHSLRRGCPKHSVRHWKSLVFSAFVDDFSSADYKGVITLKSTEANNKKSLDFFLFGFVPNLVLEHRE